MSLIINCHNLDKGFKVNHLFQLKVGSTGQQTNKEMTQTALEHHSGYFVKSEGLLRLRTSSSRPSTDLQTI